MYKKLSLSAVVLLLLPILTACGPIGEKQTSVSLVYGVLFALSLLMLLCYCITVKEKSAFFLLLFAGICVANVGYLALSLSTTVEEALLANRISYLGSVFLPMSVLMIILETCHVRYKRWMPYLLGAAAVMMFLITASPGYLDIYYQNAWLENVNGITVLCKTYGPWHSVYLYYLLAYYIGIFSVLIYSIVHKRLESRAHSFAVVGVATINLGVWLLEQLLHLNFEFLSVSYVISQLLLLLFVYTHHELVHLKSQCDNCSAAAASCGHCEAPEEPVAAVVPCADLAGLLASLTPTERTIYDYYLEGKSTREVMSLLNITENTLKYHNKNLYGKLGVSSRKQLLALSRRSS